MAPATRSQKKTEVNLKAHSQDKIPKVHKRNNKRSTSQPKPAQLTNEQFLNTLMDSNIAKVSLLVVNSKYNQYFLLVYR